MVSITSFAAAFSLCITLVAAVGIAPHLPEYSDMTKNLVNFIIKSNLRNSTIFGERTMFLITDDSLEASSMLNTISDILDLPVVILRRGFSMLNMENLRPCITFIIVKKKDEIHDILKELLASNSFKVYTPAALVICDHVEQEEEEEIADLLYGMWKTGLGRFIIIYTSDKFHVKRFNPFLNEIFEVPPEESKIFEKQLTNLHGYKFRVSLYKEWPLMKKEVNIWTGETKWIGRDITLLDNIMRLLNATYEVIEPTNNTRFRGSVQDLINNKVDFCFVRHFQAFVFEGIEYTEFNDISQLTLLVPKPRPLTRTEAMFSLISVKVWIAIFVTLFSLMIFMRIFAYFESRYHWTLLDVILDIWGMFLGTAIHRFHTYGRFLRISVILWLWGVLVVNVLFQNRLITLMQFVKYEKGIRSVRALHRSNIPIYTPGGLINFSREIFGDQIRPIEYMDIQRKLWYEKPNAAFLIPFAKIRGYVNPNIYPSNKMLSYNLLQEPIGLSFAVYLFKKHSPFCRFLSLKFLLMRQYGYSTRSSDYDRSFNQNDKGQKKLTLTQVEAAFYILIYGLILCIIVLFGEIILYSPH